MYYKHTPVLIFYKLWTPNVIITENLNKNLSKYFDYIPKQAVHGQSMCRLLLGRIRCCAARAAFVGLFIFGRFRQLDILLPLHDVQIQQAVDDVQQHLTHSRRGLIQSNEVNGLEYDLVIQMSVFLYVVD